MKTVPTTPASQSPRTRSIQPKSNEPADIKDWCLARADAWYQQKNPDLARTFLQFALDIDPRDASIWVALGSLHFAAGDLGPALLAFTQANEIKPGSPEIQLHLALTHQQREDWAETEYFFKQALEFQPDHIGALRLYSGYLMARQRPHEARLHLEHALASDLEDVDLFLRLGVCCYQTHALTASQACFKRVLQLDPTHVMARENLNVVTAAEGLTK